MSDEIKVSEQISNLKAELLESERHVAGLQEENSVLESRAESAEKKLETERQYSNQKIIELVKSNKGVYDLLSSTRKQLQAADQRVKELELAADALAIQPADALAPVIEALRHYADDGERRLFRLDTTKAKAALQYLGEK